MSDDATHIVREMVKGDGRVVFALSEFNGRPCFDVRVWAPVKGLEPVPTRKGVTMALSRLPAFLEAVEAIKDEAERRGLL